MSQVIKSASWITVSASSRSSNNQMASTARFSEMWPSLTAATSLTHCLGQQVNKSTAPGSVLKQIATKFSLDLIAFYSTLQSKRSICATLRSKSMDASKIKHLTISMDTNKLKQISPQKEEES